ncbi:uncharacterized protein LOC129781697 [Toxorhynchites rutilus septentrionalis]|uniref:uncharacterized protein LOC129781697 n=1 Tax=Toxorhynchites rutilus septentrionalis TaxID=329112 RepID=UPI00247A0B2F|nr:uncharacterized protein LOC129781697 [Toxorhynchites rutilus septentrionalis]
MAKLVSYVQSVFGKHLDYDQSHDLFSHFIWVHHYTAGIGLRRPEDWLIRTCFRAVGAFFALQQVVLVRDTFVAIGYPDDRAVRIGMMFLYSFLSMLKLIVLDACYEHFLQIRTYLNSRARRQCGGPEADRFRRDCFKMSVRGILVTELPVNLVSLAWAFMGKEEYFHFTVDLGSRFQWCSAAIDAIYGFPLIYWNNAAWIISFTVIAILQYFVGELTVIAKSFDTVLENAERDGEKLQLTGLEREKHFWASFDRRFRATVADYEEFLSMTKILRKLTTFIFLLQVLTTESLLAVTVATSFNLTFQVATALAYAIVFLIECFIVCSLIEALQDRTEMICETFIHWEWPRWMDPNSADKTARIRHVRALVTISTAHTQQRLRFRCGEMFDISMETFRMVLETCYTLLMYIRTAESARASS